MVATQPDAPAVLDDDAAAAVADRRLRWGVGTTVNDAIAGWKLNGWVDLSPTTSRRYEVIWRLHMRDSIGRRRLVDLTPWDLECYFRQLKSQGQSQASVRYARSMLLRACRFARTWSTAPCPTQWPTPSCPSGVTTSRPTLCGRRGGTDDPGRG